MLWTSLEGHSAMETLLPNELATSTRLVLNVLLSGPFIQMLPGYVPYALLSNIYSSYE